MKNNNVIKIINEEISDYDFLGNKERIKNQDNNNLIYNNDLQKQFICDSILDKSNIRQINVVDAIVGGDWEEGSDATNLSIEYHLHLSYQYDPNKEVVEFNLDFDGDSIGIDVDGYYEEETNSGNAWFKYIEWSDINVTLFTLDGDNVPFDELDRAPSKIRNSFIKKYTKPFIESKTNLDIKTTQV